MPTKIETKTYVYSTFHICWGAQAGLYYHDGIHKHDLQEKLFGVFPHMVVRRSSMFMRGFDDTFMVPHSRHTTIRREEVEACGKLKILASSPKVGIYALLSEGRRQIFITGHSEYNAGTLQKECLRDKTRACRAMCRRTISRTTTHSRRASHGAAMPTCSIRTG